MPTAGTAGGAGRSAAGAVAEGLAGAGCLDAAAMAGFDGPSSRVRISVSACLRKATWSSRLVRACDDGMIPAREENEVVIQVMSRRVLRHEGRLVAVHATIRGAQS